MGLWKAIEQMRRGEKSEIMIKPAHAFGHPDFQNELLFPKEWDTEERKAILRRRRTYYEVKLYDWIVRHDLDGDGILIKTVEQAGVGYERCQKFDDLLLSFSCSQKDAEGKFVNFYEKENFACKHKDEALSETLRKILASMKRGEKTSTIVHPAFFMNFDKEFVKKFNIDCEKLLKVEINLHGLEKVEDLYKDETTLYKSDCKG